MKIIDINGNPREATKIAIDKEYPGFMKIEFISKNRKGFAHSEWYPIAEFIKNNPSLAYLAKGAPKPPQEDLGTVTSASSLTLKDRTKKWSLNLFAGYPVWIARGKGEGQVRTIVSNSKNSLIINKPWQEIPDKTSQYLISHHIHNPQTLGNTLKGVK